MYSSLSAQPMPWVYAALDLAFDVGRMDRPADILRGRIARDGNMPGLRIDFDIADMRRKGRPGSLCVDRHLGTDRSTGACRLDGDVGQGQRVEAAGVGTGRYSAAVLPVDRVGADVPDHRGAALQLVDDFLRGLHGRHAGRKGHAAAAGYV